MPSFQQIIETIRRDPRIPAPSQTVFRVLELTRDFDCDMRKVAAVIGGDAGLTAQLLREVNSALYGQLPTSSVTAACVRMGVKRVRAAVVNHHVVSGLKAARPAGLDAFRYWQGAFATSVAAQELAKRLVPARLEEAGTAGLLCDLGIGLLALGAAKSYAAVTAQWGGGAYGDLHRIEERVLGVTHAEVGAAVLADWKLDPDIVEAVRGHHRLSGPGDAKERSPFARIVAAAATLSCLALDGSQMEYVEALFQHVASLAPQPDELVGQLLDVMVIRIQQMAEAFSVALGSTERMQENFAGLSNDLAVRKVQISYRPMQV